MLQGQVPGSRAEPIAGSSRHIVIGSYSTSGTTFPGFVRPIAAGLRRRTAAHPEFSWRGIMSNQGYGRNPADYGPLPGQEAGYGQGAYQNQGAAYASQDPGYGQAGYGTQGAGYSTQGAEYAEQATTYAEQATTARSSASHASAKGFVSSLFDFG